MVHIGWSQLDVMRKVNVEGARTVAQAARAAGARMVHVSSVDALGIGSWEAPGHEEMGTEGAIPMPYVLTKREAEEAVLAEVERGLDATIVEPAYMLGPHDWKPSSGKLLIEIATRWVPFYPTGGNNFADVRDVAAGTLAALARGQRGRRYILGGENHTYQDAFRIFAALGGRSPPAWPLGPVNRWLIGSVLSAWTWVSGSEPALNSAALEAGTKPHYFTSDRAARELGYTFRPLEESARDAWEWFQREGYVK
jgi:dihydroflavonol-4-reductase